MKKDYYEILGVTPHSSKEEIRNAYRELVKKYHPDQYRNNPLEDLAQEKLKKINEAYDYLMDNHTETNNKDTDYQNNGYRNNEENGFQKVRVFIHAGNWEAAYTLLQTLNRNHPDWHFLNGLIALNKGWYQQAHDYIKTALSIDPGNAEYLSAFNNMYQKTNYYRDASMQRGYQRSGGLCELCTCLYCSDCCCECFGGDMIGCC